MVKRAKPATAAPSGESVPADDLADRLRTVTDAIPGLRRHGVSHLRLGDLEIRIEPLQPDAVEPRDRQPPGLADLLDPERFRPARREVPE